LDLLLGRVLALMALHRCRDMRGGETWTFLKGPREKNSKFKIFVLIFAHFLLECVHVCLYESLLVSDLDVGMFIL
jgi:hypothetical protein